MTATRSLLLAAGLLLAGAPATAQQGQAPYTIAETGQRFASLQQAVDAIGSRRATITVASGSWRDCAVQTAGYIAFRAAEPGKAIFDGGACEGKATLVLRGQGAEVHGLIFQNIAVPDANGAGIRLETGDLVVSNSLFRDSEQGILTANDPASSILIERSTFSRLGRCDRGLSCAHSIYVNDFGSLTVRQVRFEKGNGGHYLKSRAAKIEVTDCSFDDTQGRTTNYLIDLPAGAQGTIARNIFVQGRDKENYSAFIAVAAEGRVYSSAGLSITDNDARIAPGVDRSTIFVANWSDDRLALGDNRLGPRLTAYQKR